MFPLAPNGISTWLKLRPLAFLFALLGGISVLAQNSLPINLQGRVTVNGVAFGGSQGATGRFKFALGAGPVGAPLWTHDGTSPGVAGEPAGFVSLTVARGLYSVLLGDTTVPGMTQPIPLSVFNNSDVRVRIWFSDGTNGFQRLQPDQRLSAVGFAAIADRAREAIAFSGPVALTQLPANLVTNNSTNVSITGQFNGQFNGIGAGLIGIRGSTPWTVPSGTNINIFPNTGYMVTNAAETSLLLPETSALQVGDVIRVSGANPGSWKITQRAGQTIAAKNLTGGIGARWVARDVIRNWTGIASSANGSILVAGVAGGTGSNPLMVSTNAGATWYNPNPTTAPQRNWRSVAGSAEGTRWLAGTDGFIFVSNDSAQTWVQNANPGSRIWTGVAASANGSNLVAVSQNTVGAPGPLYVSSDGGSVWTQRPNIGSHVFTSVATSSDGTNIITGALGDSLWISNDRGTNWAARGPSGRNWTSVASSADGLRLIAAASAFYIHTSPNGGTNWIERTSAGLRNWTSVASSADGLKLAAMSEAGVSVSIDGGINWNLRPGSPLSGKLTMAPDATRLAATASFLHISVATAPRTTTLGTEGYLLGDEFSAIELQYAGNGLFFPLSSSGTIYAF